LHFYVPTIYRCRGGFSEEAAPRDLVNCSNFHASNLLPDG
jgi:hypothetical protein